MKIKLNLLFVGMLLIASSYGQQKNLAFFLTQAVENSPLLKDYANQIQSAYYDSLLIRASYKPQVSAYSYNSYAPMINGYGYDAAITNGGILNTVVRVNKDILNGKSINAQLRNTYLSILSTTNTAKLSAQDLKKTVTTQYILAYNDLLKLAFNKKIDSLLFKEDYLLKKLTQNNVYKQVDYLVFLLTVQQQRLNTEQLAIQYQNNYTLLNYLIGVNDTTINELQNPTEIINHATFLSNTLFLKQFEIDSLKLNNNKTLVDNNYRPKINLFADAGYNASIDYAAYKNLGSSFGISAVVPIYDGKQRKMQYNKIAIQENTRANYKSFYLKQYEMQTALLTQQLSNIEKLKDNILLQEKYAESLITTNNKLLQTGEVRIADYILSLNGYLNIKNLSNQNLITQLQIINELNYRNK